MILMTMLINKIREKDLVREEFDGLTKEVLNWECLNVYSIFKGDISKKSELEIIQGYAKATNDLFNCFYQDNHIFDGHSAVFREDTQAYPFVFLCRHTLELLIKYLSSVFSIEYDASHKLEKLWQPVQQELKKKEYGISSNDMSNFNVLVKAISKLDPDGQQARYTKSKENKTYKSKPVFIKSKLINELLQHMVEVLLKLDCLNEENKNESDN